MFNKKIISLDIGSKYIKIVLGFQDGDIVKIENAIKVPTPPSLFQNGKILDANLFKEFIQNTLKSNKTNSKRAIFTVQSKEIIIREVILPIVKPKEMKSMITYELEQYLPIKMDEYILEYKIQEEFLDNPIKKARILVALFPKYMVQTYLQLLNEIGLKTIALDINANAVSKLFYKDIKINNNDLKSYGTVAIIDLGHKNINIDIICKDTLMFTRMIEIKKRDMDKSVYYYSDIYQKDDLDISSEHMDWIIQIQRSFDYYIIKSSENNIDCIFAHGGRAMSKDMLKYMEDFFEIPIVKIKSISSIKFLKHEASIPITFYLNAAGAIIRR